MKIGDRIRICRIEKGYSQDELAKRLGYKSRSSINKIERDASGLPQTKIAAIAEALGTTPGYIMGWEEKPMIAVTQPTIKQLGSSVVQKKPTSFKKFNIHKVFSMTGAANAARFVRQQLGLYHADQMKNEPLKVALPTNSHPIFSHDLGEIENELVKICSALDVKSKHALLTKAYELASQSNPKPNKFS